MVRPTWGLCLQQTPQSPASRALCRLRAMLSRALSAPFFAITRIYDSHQLVVAVNVVVFLFYNPLHFNSHVYLTRFGMSASQISQIETGWRADPGFSTVLRLAKALQVSMDALAGLKESRAHQPRMSRFSKAALERAKRQLEDAGQRIAEVLEYES